MGQVKQLMVLFGIIHPTKHPMPAPLFLIFSVGLDAYINGLTYFAGTEMFHAYDLLFWFWNLV